VRRKPQVLLALALATAGAAAVSAFDVPTHRAITQQRLRPLRATLSNGSSVGFSQRALEEVAQANEDTDDLSSAALFHPERHFTNERFAASLAELNTNRTNVINSVKTEPRNGNAARRSLGRALHGIQDFYSHSNWVEQGKAAPGGPGGAPTLPNPPLALRACPVNGNTLGPNGGGGDTSGYYVGLLGCGSIPDGKCWHGNYTSSCPGINKDKPAFPNHGAARGAAEQATTNFVQGIIDELSAIGNATERDKALMALLDARGTTAFIIDDTGSMGGAIDGVKGVVAGIVAELASDPDLKPTNWVVERFGDPDFGPPFETEDASAALSRVQALSASGGGDCPELSQSGLLQAVDAALPNSTLFLFTDATAKDSGAANAVIAKAREKSIVINYALSGSCSPIDPAYIRGASETGGFLISMTRAAGDVTKLLPLFLAQARGDLTRIISSRGTLSGVESVTAPVDSTARRLVIVVNTAAANTVAVRRPSGALVAPGDADANIATVQDFVQLPSGVFVLQRGTVVTVNAPAIGAWRVEMTGTGAFAVTADANSPLELRRFAIVEPNADIHGGYFPIVGQPLAGSSVTGDATVLGPFARATFAAVDASGVALKPLPLVQNFPDAAADHFLGAFSLPAVPFRVVAEGEDESGHAFRREFPALFTGQPASVKVDVGSVDTLSAGASRSFDVTITNTGAPATYNLQATSSVAGIAAAMSPASVTVAGGATAASSLTIAVPAGTTAEDVTVTITATNTADSAIFNSASARFAIVTNSPPDVTGAAPTIASLWPVNHRLVEVGITGITDPDGDTVAVRITRIMQSEPADGAGDGATCADASGEGTSTALLRAERSGTGSGRLYVIEFTAEDGKGGSATGSVTVSVPKSASQPAKDSGLRFASAACR
jgi:hypothetical protein